MFSETRLNNVVVKPLVNTTNIDIKKVKGGALIPDPFSTVFLCAKRKSGKTSVLGEILLKCSDRKTIIWIFCPTTNVDDNWKAIIKNLQEKGNVVNIFDSLMDKKTNQLDEIINSLIVPDEEEDDKPKKPEKPPVRLLFDHTTIEEEIKEEKEKKYKPKKIAPKHIFVLDDLSHELKNQAVYKLLKNGRHLKAMCILSFQYCNDLLPAGYKQAQYVLLFRSFSRDKLEHLHKQLDLTMSLDQFYELYDYIMRNSNYDFEYIDVKNQTFRKNFNKKINFEMLE